MEGVAVNSNLCQFMKLRTASRTDRIPTTRLIGWHQLALGQQCLKLNIIQNQRLEKGKSKV